MNAKKMICPACGAEMNRHAMKVQYDIEDPELVDPVFHGALKEVHACPNCGRTELRDA